MKTLKAACMAGIAAIMLSAAVPAMAQPFGNGDGYGGPRFGHGDRDGYRHRGRDGYGYRGERRRRYRDDDGRGFGFGPRHHRGFFDRGRDY